MCLMSFQWNIHPDYPLILVSNREEAYGRPTSRLHFWKDHPQLIAGRDLKAMGTWMGMSTNGRIASLTNDMFSSVEHVEPTTSRGNLVKDFLLNESPPLFYGVNLKDSRKQFRGYQLLFGDLSQLFVYQNATGLMKRLKAGTHSISNALSFDLLERNTRGKALLERYIEDNPTSLNVEELASLFSDAHPAEDVSYLTSELKISEEEAKKYSSVFIEGEEFGTVSTSVILVDKHGHTTFLERKYNKKNRYYDTQYEFDISQK